MSVVEVIALHARYVRVSDRFKAMWTWHQFASGTFRALLQTALPYDVDFPKVYDGIKTISSLLNVARAERAAAELERADADIGKLIQRLVVADDRIPASLLRRFFGGAGRSAPGDVLATLREVVLAEAGEEEIELVAAVALHRVGVEVELDQVMNDMVVLPLELLGSRARGAASTRPRSSTSSSVTCCRRRCTTRTRAFSGSSIARASACCAASPGCG